MAIATAAHGNQLEVIEGVGNPEYVNFDDLDIVVNGTKVSIRDNSTRTKLSEAVFSDYSIGGVDAMTVARNIAGLAGAGSPVTITGTADVNLAQVDGNAVEAGAGNVGTGTQRVVLASDQPQVDINIAADGVGLATESGGNLDTIATDTTSIDAKIPALGQAAKAASVPVTLASDEDNVNTVAIDPSTGGTPSSVAASATSVQLLAANSNRVEAIIRNDSTAILYVEEGSAATTNSAIRLIENGVAIINSTLQINGIWESATGNARITETTK